jgi:hypothetical protein
VRDTVEENAAVLKMDGVEGRREQQDRQGEGHDP